METRQLAVELRTAIGSTALKGIRREGQIPAIIYAQGKDARALQLTEYDYRRTVGGGLSAQLFELKSSNEDLDGQLAIIKEVCMEPIKEKVLHVDFLAIDKGQQITVSVPITLLGEPAAVKHGEAVLNVQAHEVEVKCIPANIPSEIFLDISKLEEGDSLHVSNLVAPEGVVIESEDEMTIASLVAKRVEVEAPAAVEAEGAEAAAAEGAEAGAESKEGD